MTSAQLRKGDDRPVIRWAVVSCELGWMAVAATRRGVCLIRFGDTAGELREDLARRFAAAQLREGDLPFQQWVRQLVQCVEGSESSVDLPLDIEGTPFQRRVWEQLCAVPAGETATYAEIARGVGKPRAVRAVANACGANKLAVVIPCHRIIRTDGSLGGYRWGLQRKRKLLEREAAI